MFCWTAEILLGMDYRCARFFISQNFWTFFCDQKFGILEVWFDYFSETRLQTISDLKKMKGLISVKIPSVCWRSFLLGRRDLALNDKFLRTWKYRVIYFLRKQDCSQSGRLQKKNYRTALNRSASRIELSQTDVKALAPSRLVSEEGWLCLSGVQRKSCAFASEKFSNEWKFVLSLSHRTC